MKSPKNQLGKVFSAMFVISTAISCNAQESDVDHNHDDMMNDQQTEMPEGDDHMHDGQSTEHMTDDSISREMNEHME